MINHPDSDWLHNQYVVIGMETPEIGELCGVTYKTVCRWLSEAGIPNRRSPISKETYNAIQVEYTDANEKCIPINLDAVSKKLGHSKTTICRCARYMGLTNVHRPKGVTRDTGWTDAKIKFLIDNFRRMTYPELGKHLEFEEVAIRRKLMECGLKKQDSDRWKYQAHPRGMLSKHHSPETCMKMAERMRRDWNDPDSSYNSNKTSQIRSDNMTRFRATYAINNPYSRTKSGKRVDLNDRFFRSAWEANFARYLNFLQSNGDIHRWEYEPDRFDFTEIKRGTRSYLPDFKVWDTKDAEPYYYEVKGWMDAKSKTKLKRMAKYYPGVKIIVFGQKEYNSLKKNLSKVIPYWEGK